MSESLFKNFERGVGAQSNPPSATFAPESSIAGTLSLQFRTPNKQGKIFLGTVGSAIKEFRLPDERLERHASGGSAVGVADDRHIVTIAGSRSGKGRSTIITNLITYPGSMIVIDPKGDLARDTALWRSEVLGHKVVNLDPFEASGELARLLGGGYNSLTLIHPKSATQLEDAGRIADSLIVPSGAKDPHWDESAKQFAVGVILHVATYPLYRNVRNLVTVYRCIMERSSALKAEMAENNAAEGAVIALANQFFDKPDNERSSVLSNLRRHVNFLGFPQMESVLSAHSFELRDLKTSPLTVYLSLPAMRMGICAGWLRLFVNLALAAFEEEKTKPPFPVLMCMDEFAVLGRLQALEDAAGQIAGLGCKLWPILQDLGQLEALYEKRWATFLGNAGTLQFFGNSDMKTLEWISSRLGTCTIQTSSKNSAGYMERANSGNTGQSFSQSVHPLMTAEEISRFFGRDDELARQLIIRPSSASLVLHRAYYDSHQLFRPYRKFMNMPEKL
ncbi:type IV secretory system conjugative DNA transfer family protein [Luteolibacter sp. Populi]|uniref:type IV secretory system conjugative DNA transfer family protein n=1 Tax=Luteolibacter sp. Populi TaxID=3230487 RepID=UPI00346575C3